MIRVVRVKKLGRATGPSPLSPGWVGSLGLVCVTFYYSTTVDSGSAVFGWFATQDPVWSY